MSANADLENRLQTLEEHLARQENLLLQLNDVVAQMRAELDRFETTYSEQQNKLRAMLEGSFGSGAMEIEKPPHY